MVNVELLEPLRQEGEIFETSPAGPLGIESPEAD